MAPDTIGKAVDFWLQCRHPPVRDVSERETVRETKELHCENHPPVAIKFGAEPLVTSRHGRMQLCFQVEGALIGFKYRIVLKEVATFW